MTEARTYMDGYSDGKEWAQPEPSYTAIHSEHCFQPPYETSCKYGDSDCPASYKAQHRQTAPSEAAREYMTGYSDGREWAGATSQAQPSQADAQDAARYRWLRSTTNWASNSSNERIDVRNSPELWDAAIDAAIQKELTP